MAPSELHTSRTRKWLLTAPPLQWASTQLRELFISSVRQGPVPQHIAFVMDGNRRFARANHIETVEGHNLGFEALAKILEVSYKSGVKVVTVYAFSIENFKRPVAEVNALMEIAKIKLLQLCQHGDLLQEYGASLRILGDRELVRKDVLEVMDEAVELTRGNDRCVFFSVAVPMGGHADVVCVCEQCDLERVLPVHIPPRNRVLDPLHRRLFHVRLLAAVPVLRHHRHPAHPRLRVDHAADNHRSPVHGGVSAARSPDPDVGGAQAQRFHAVAVPQGYRDCVHRHAVATV